MTGHGETLEGKIREAARLLVEAEHAIALTGAGISTPSGIPDFRGPQGLWRRISPRVFHIDYFRENPEESWKVFLELYESMKHVRPNPAHHALAELERHGIIKAVITQNIDGLHQAAGSKNVIELHGSLKHAVCLNCGHRIPLEEAVKMAKQSGAPRCPRCGGLLKPDVVFFGEKLPQEAVEEAIRQAAISDLVLVVGSSLAVTPANQIPLIAKHHGAKIIIVNLGETLLDHIADIKIEAPVEEALPQIAKRAITLLKTTRENKTSNNLK